MIRPARAATLAALWSLLPGAAPEAPRPSTTREVAEQGYRVRLDLAPQVLSIEIPEEHVYGEREAMEAPIRPTLGGIGGEMVSGSMLAQKAKQFDDGLHAAVELAAQDGAGIFAGKASMLRGLAARTRPGAMASGRNNAVSVLLAACRLGKVPVEVPTSLEAAVDAVERQFLADPLRSRPMGFYTGSPALSDIFRQDRMLQSELEGAEGIGRLARALADEPEPRATYDAYLSLTDRLTNPGSGLADLRGVVRAIQSGRPGKIPDKGVAVFPASRGHETDLVMKLYGNKPIPDGFSLVDEMVRRIRSGRLDLKPTARSGWYDYQTWALEPLVVPEKMPEAARLRLGPEYRKQLLELFQGVLALTRETHVKQLAFPTAGAMLPVSEKPPVVIDIRPDLPAEPLVTYYWRRAESYEFIREALRTTFGPAGLEAIRRRSAPGADSTSLAAELDAMIGLFRGAAEATARRLGMPLDPAPDAAEASFRSWAKAAGDDPDVGRDSRMMVPVFYDLVRRKSKVWVFLGWSSRPAVVSFATPPTFETFRDGRKVEGKEAPRVNFRPSVQPLAYPVTAEVYVDELLDRDQFRKLCDVHKTRKAILGHLK